MAIVKFANQRGIPCVESIAVNVGTDAVKFVFANHENLGYNYQGLILVRIQQPFTQPSTAVKVQFVTEGVANSEQTLKNLDDADLTTADFHKTGIYMFFYDRPTNKLQLVSRML